MRVNIVREKDTRAGEGGVYPAGVSFRMELAANETAEKAQKLFDKIRKKNASSHSAQRISPPLFFLFYFLFLN